MAVAIEEQKINRRQFEIFSDLFVKKAANISCKLSNPVFWKKKIVKFLFDEIRPERGKG